MTIMITSRPLILIVLAPPVDTIAGRERACGKTAHDTWTIEQLDRVLRHETPLLGLWLDSSGQTAAESVDEILARAWSEASIRTPPNKPTRTQPRAN